MNLGVRGCIVASLFVLVLFVGTTEGSGIGLNNPFHLFQKVTNMLNLHSQKYITFLLLLVRNSRNFSFLNLIVQQYKRNKSNYSAIVLIKSDLYIFLQGSVQAGTRKLLGLDVVLDYDYAGPNPRHEPRGRRGGGRP